MVCGVVHSIGSAILPVWVFCGNLPGSSLSVLQQGNILRLALNLVYQENLYPLIMVHDMFYPMFCKGWFFPFIVLLEASLSYIYADPEFNTPQDLPPPFRLTVLLVGDFLIGL